MNRKTLMYKSLLIGLLVLLLPFGSFAKGPEQVKINGLAKTTTAIDPVRSLSNINNWSYWLYSDGHSGIDPDGNGGGIYPRGTANVIYADGLVWGANINGDIKVGGDAYRTGTQASLDHIFRIRSDWAKLDKQTVAQDAAEFYQKSVETVTDVEASDLIDQYKADWKNWPVAAGAPYVDKDGDGTYNPVLDSNNMPDSSQGDYPGIANADQVVFFVYNDSDAGRTTNLYGSDPMGIEVQTTVWGYNQKEGTLGQIMFKKYKIINTSNTTFDSMYVAQWCDPDVGNYTDDLVGCDPALGLGFAYNGSPVDDDFAAFDQAPSAMGYDFFQGPVVAGVEGEDINNNGIDDAIDSAVINLKKVGPGLVNLPMTAFLYFSAGNSEWTDPQQGVYDGTLEWYNLLRGFISNTNIANPTPFTHRATGKATKFPLNGDPVTGIGDVDGNPALGNFAPADRRMGLSTGPFTMAPGDEQEVVVAILGGESGSLEKGGRLQSVFALKVNDDLAQSLYNTLFAEVPKPPSPPVVEITPTERTIAIEWGFDTDAVKATENPAPAGYAFEGYNVYQLPTATSRISDGKLVQVFDLKDNVKKIQEVRFDPAYGQGITVPIRFGTDSGIQRYFAATKDYLNDKPLYPGNTYYFAVTAYNYKPTAEVVKSLESPAVVIPVTTQSGLPGQKVAGKAGEALEVDHSKGKSEGSVQIIVVNPKKTTGHKYTVTFAADTDTVSATYGDVIWNLTDLTTGNVVLAKQSQLAPGDLSGTAPIADGMQIKVFGPPPGIKYWNYAGNRWISGVNWGGGYLFGGLDLGANFFGSTITDPATYTNVTLFWAGTDLDPTTNSEADIIADSKAKYPDFWSKGQTYRRDLGYPASGAGDIPFAAFDMEQDPPRRLNICFVEDASAGSANLTWDMGWDGSAFAGLGGREYTFIMNSDYNEGADYDNVNWGPAADVLYAIWPNARGSRPYLLTPFELYIVANHVNSTIEEFSFTSPVFEQSVALEKTGAEKVTVFPNPYYAGNAQESNRFNRFVTFYHLTEKATIRIFNLAGEQVRKLEKPVSNTTQFMQWDLRNENSLPVASGIYFAHVEMNLSNGSKVTKVLKLFIIQRRQQIKFF